MTDVDQPIKRSDYVTDDVWRMRCLPHLIQGLDPSADRGLSTWNYTNSYIGGHSVSMTMGNISSSSGGNVHTAGPTETCPLCQAGGM